MEEMRNTALAYYANMSYDQQLKVLGFYKSIDTNGDGKVSIQEYLDFLKQKGINQFVPPNLFKLLDKNNDGTLDFEECVTFYYMATGRRLVICDGCRSYLWGLHFLCVECYSAGGRTFDLCCSCYRNNNFSHAHSHFLDNYALLRTRPWEGNTSAGAGNTSAGAGRSYYQSGDTSAGAGRSYSQHSRAAEAVETAVRVVDVAGKVAGAASNAYNFGSSLATAASASTTYNFGSSAASAAASAASVATVCTIM